MHLSPWVDHLEGKEAGPLVANFTAASDDLGLAGPEQQVRRRGDLAGPACSTRDRCGDPKSAPRPHRATHASHIHQHTTPAYAPTHLAMHASHAHNTQSSFVSTFFPPMSCARFSPHTRWTGWKGSQEEALSRRETTGACSAWECQHVDRKLYVRATGSLGGHSLHASPCSPMHSQEGLQCDA